MLNAKEQYLGGAGIPRLSFETQTPSVKDATGKRDPQLHQS